MPPARRQIPSPSDGIMEVAPVRLRVAASAAGVAELEPRTSNTLPPAFTCHTPAFTCGGARSRAGAARSPPVETGNDTEIDRVGADHENDRNGCSCSFGSYCSWRGGSRQRLPTVEGSQATCDASQS